MTSCTLWDMLLMLLQSLMCSFHFLRFLQQLQSWRLCLRNLGKFFWHRFALISLWSLGQALGFPLVRIPSQNLPNYTLEWTSFASQISRRSMFWFLFLTYTVVLAYVAFNVIAKGLTPLHAWYPVSNMPAKGTQSKLEEHSPGIAMDTAIIECPQKRSSRHLSHTRKNTHNTNSHPSIQYCYKMQDVTWRSLQICAIFVPQKISHIVAKWLYTVYM